MKSICQALTIIMVLYLIPLNLAAQSENTWSQPPELEIMGYVDVFYVYDFNKPTTKQRQPFFYNHNRHNEFNINQGLIGLSVTQTKYRAVITLQAGTYANDNYADEPGVLKNIFEAYAGIALNKKNNLWIDAGIFISHLGIESPLSIDNWTLTRSLGAENLPYYLAGAKITYSPSDVITILGVVSNGWQRIQRVEGNSLPSIGTQVLIKPNKKYTFNWSTLIGTDDPDSTRRMRYFNNIYGEFQFVEKFGVIAGFDFGTQQKAKSSSDYDTWYGMFLIARYTFAEKWGTTLRGEYYYDNERIIISMENSTLGFKTSGLSLNIDFRPIPEVACRIEGRWLSSYNEIFTKDDTFVNNNFFIAASIAVKMGKKIL